MNARSAYFCRMALERITRWRFDCPNCGCTKSSRIDRKYIVTELRRCRDCHLMFRAPSDPPQFNEKFYNESYDQGFTTDMPKPDELEQLKATRFRGSPKDYVRYLDVLKRFDIDQGSRIFDFGCSWGYGSWQMQQAGLEVWAAEISHSRRAYASEKLGVQVVGKEVFDDSGISELGLFDCFFSAHVLEHVPKPYEVFELASRLLRPGGLFVSFTPNGSAEHREQVRSWRKLWGSVHPNLIDDVFLDHSFSDAARLLTSTRASDDWLQSLHLPHSGAHRFGLEGSELLCVAQLSEKRSWRDRK